MTWYFLRSLLLDISQFSINWLWVMILSRTSSQPAEPVGSDGLTQSERTAYEQCRPISCRPEACFTKHMYSSPKKIKQECEPMMQLWRTCFKTKLDQLQSSPASVKAAATHWSRSFLISLKPLREMLWTASIYTPTLCRPFGKIRWHYLRPP